MFAADSVRDMFRELAANSVVWYASDQSYSRKGSALLPFFGEPAMTNTSISRIARATGAVVLPYFSRRLEDARYEVAFGAPLDDFPTDDPAHDTARLMAKIEEFVRTCPEQRNKRWPSPRNFRYAASGGRLTGPRGSSSLGCASSRNYRCAPKCGSAAFSEGFSGVFACASGALPRVILKFAFRSSRPPLASSYSRAT
jgi:hypothetical protein